MSYDWEAGVIVGKNSVFRIAKTEYVKWICNPKLMIVAVMIIFAYDYVIKELTVAADKMGCRLNIFEGFIGITNSQLLVLIIPVVFLGIMGDFPRVDGNSVFYLSRVGRINWLFGQVVFAMMAAGTYLALLFGFSIVTVVGRSFTANVWSDVTTRYYLFAPDDYGSKVANLTTGRLYNNVTPGQATVHILGLMFLLMVLISVVLLVMFVMKMRMAGIILTTAMLCIGCVLSYMDIGVKWIFPTNHTILEIHFDEIYRKPIMDIAWSYLYYIGIIVVLLIVAVVRIDKFDFSKIQELEE